MADDAGDRLPPAVETHGLGVAYGPVRALDRVDLRVAAGETTALLGPSGAGKTTLLHAVAGFVAPDAGEVRIGGRAVASPAGSLPPEHRSVAVVFQHFALWPHLTAVENVAYPLRRKGHAAAPARREALGLLERMDIGDLAGRRPAELSGGQQQRVGLARAVARDAAVYLLDEPTAHLDAAMRSALEEELTTRRRGTGAAALHATHDAAEALAVADRVLLMRDGRVVQSGSPPQVYEQPVDLWAAQLTGPASLLEDAVRRRERGAVVLAVGPAEARVPVCGHAAPAAPSPVLLRPEWLTLTGPLPGTVAHVWYRGPHTDYRLATPAGAVTVREPGPPRAAVGDAPGWQAHRAWLL